MPRVRDLGIGIGPLPPGPTNSVLDVTGVGLGHTTLVRDEPPPPQGRGTARTGVSVLVLADDAYARPLSAGGAVLNAAGECTGLIGALELGVVETPVYLTSTMQLGRVYDSACRIAVAQHRDVADDVVIPVVAECDDSFLSDVRAMQVEHDDVVAAHRSALDSRGGTDVVEGAVGAGTGMSCLGFKGGIGTSSRVTADGHTVAVLLLTNFGEQHRLTVDGVPVGAMLPPETVGPRAPAGSCIGVVVTDAPVTGGDCSRLARRVGLGLGRTGSYAHHGSGEIFFAASTTHRSDRTGGWAATKTVAGRALDPLFAAVVDSAEEAVLNSLLTAGTTVGRDGHTSRGLDPAEVTRLWEEARGGRH